MVKILAIANQKGGVGKTSTTMNLGYALAISGKKVLIIDFDSQANLTQCMDIKRENVKNSIATLMNLEIEDEELPAKEDYIVTRNGVDIIVSDISLSMVDAKLWHTTIFAEKILSIIIDNFKDEYDYILIDTPSSLGILSINAFVATDSVIIPMNAEAMSADGVQSTLKTIVKIRKRFNRKLKVEGILFTMADSRTNLYKVVTETVKKSCENRIYVFNTQIPRNVKVSEANLKRMSVIEYNKNSVVAKAYMDLAKELISKNEK